MTKQLRSIAASVANAAGVVLIGTLCVQLVGLTVISEGVGTSVPKTRCEEGRRRPRLVIITQRVLARILAVGVLGGQVSEYTHGQKV